MAWLLWNHRNRCVFDGVQPNLNGILSSIRDEKHVWSWLGLEESLISSPYSIRVRLNGLVMG
jgi:hypothetical protein